jgi:hypothetical protein
MSNEWLSDFLVFASDSKEDGYAAGLTIERKDNDGDYCRENCIWIPLPDQAKNRRTSAIVTYQGESMIMEDAIRKSGIKHGTVYDRIRRGWSLDDALSIPPNKYRRYKSHK